VDVRAVKKAEQGDEVILRCQELWGDAAMDVHLSLHGGLLSAREVNASEEPLGPARMDGGDLVTDFEPFQPRTFAVRLAAPPARLRPPVSRPIALPYDLDVVGLEDQKEGGDFDGAGHSLPGELLASPLVVEGLRFQFGPAGGGAKNALTCAGQAILLPQGNYNRLYLLAAAVPAEKDTAGDGGARAVFLVDGQPVELTVQDFSGFVGQWDSRVVGGRVVGIGQTAPAFIRRDPIAWIADHRHARDGKNEPYVFCYLFKYRIDLAKGAKTLVLPKNDRLRILAATAALNSNDDTRPAQLLYD
jgi:alpha-mannosidase